jgi:ATP-dependent exoDNAse (exonuclease V) beta subunit
MNSITKPAPPDQAQREQALDAGRSILVQAPAGSGKTDLLTRRFLRLLSEVDDPTQIVAITFTKAAAAEMRHRILSELEKAALIADQKLAVDEFSMESLARRALTRSRALDWKLLDLPAQLRISTIDSFCRELALQQPLLSGLGGGLDVSENPAQLYRRAARQTLEQIGNNDATALSSAIETLLMWRDNGWQEMEDLLVNMLSARDRWMHDFVLTREPDWDALRLRLERPMARAVADAIHEVSALLGHVPDACDEAMELARFACEQGGDHRDLAELAKFPCGPFAGGDELEQARQSYLCLAKLLLTGDGDFRKAVDKRHGFPAHLKREKERILDLIRRLDSIPGLQQKFAALRELPPARYADEDWEIVRASFTLLRHAAGQLHVAFAEAGVVDFTEVSQVAQHVLADEEGFPTDAAMAIADGIRHLLVDEFQDTSRRQHKLLASLVAAWPDTEGRTLFVVGDHMQSIYSFRDADAELFPRVKNVGLELPNGETHEFNFVPLSSNFRTAPMLVETLNASFEAIFAEDDGSGVTFSRALAARLHTVHPEPHFDINIEFVPQSPRGNSSSADSAAQKQQAIEARDAAREKQTDQIVALIRERLEAMEEATRNGDKYRIAVLGRTRSALAPIAQALREASIPFRAVDLEPLANRPEVLDVLSLARALFNREDRVAWLGILRAPWCGLSLADLHMLTSADDAEIARRPIGDLLAERAPLLSIDGQRAIERVMRALEDVPALRAALPTASHGTWLEQVWLGLGGADCVDAAARVNLELLWKCLDDLPDGEPDVLGRELNAALEKLTAQPDPNADAACGVQLMTIHKSKGLEFEVVIVPELQAGCGTSGRKLLSWLERGVASAEDSGEITEFLVAPLQTKGGDRGKAKEWVDRVLRARELQETRRILYVAATRAREQLHLFARPAYKTQRDGSIELCEPAGSLLATAWPALESAVQTQFAKWKAAKHDAHVDSIAAVATDNLLVMPNPVPATNLRRLPSDYQASQSLIAATTTATSRAAGIGSARLYDRHEGGLISRSFGNAVHSLLEELARLRTHHAWPAACESLRVFEARIAAQIRSKGVAQPHSAKLAAQALDAAMRIASDPIAEWILSPHSDAGSESRWAGIVAGGLRTVQVDRIFRAGTTPLSTGTNVWWIIDYKTAHDDNADPAETLPQFRRQFAPQLEIYAEVLRNLHGDATQIRAGLYYPRMLQFDWWQI